MAACTTVMLGLIAAISCPVMQSAASAGLFSIFVYNGFVSKDLNWGEAYVAFV
jgi:hypothetical protein